MDLACTPITHEYDIASANRLVLVDPCSPCHSELKFVAFKLLGQNCGHGSTCLPRMQKHRFAQEVRIIAQRSQMVTCHLSQDGGLIGGMCVNGWIGEAFHEPMLALMHKAIQ